MTRAIRRALMVFAVMAGVAATAWSAHAKTPFDTMGEAAGDKCIRTVGGSTCCRSEMNCDQYERTDPKADPSKPNTTLAICRQGQRVCEKMMTCNRALNACKKEKMETDKSCTGDACKKCTSDYKSCHDSATN